MTVGKMMDFSKHKQSTFTKINRKFFEQNNEAILMMLGSDATKAADFKYAQRVLLHLKLNADFSNYVFTEWSKQTAANEKELLITRFVLAYSNKKNCDEETGRGLRHLRLL